MSFGYIMAQLLLIGTKVVVQNYYDNNNKPARPPVGMGKKDTGMPVDGVCYENEKSRAVILHGIKKVDYNIDLYKLINYNYNTIVIPETVGLIEEKLFNKISDRIAIVCHSGSSAEEYAILNGLNYTIDDDFYKDKRYHYQVKSEDSLKKTEEAKKISDTGALSVKTSKTEITGSRLAFELCKYLKWQMKYCESSEAGVTTSLYFSYNPNNPFLVKYTGPLHKNCSSYADNYDVIYYDDKICEDMLYDSLHRKKELTEIFIKPGTECIECSALCDTNTVKRIVLPDSVSVIKTGAFERSGELSLVKMSKNIKRINDAAFRFCPKLESIELPEGLQHIGRQAFRKCTSLESVKIPDSISFLGSYAFHKCINLKEVFLSKSLTVINEGMFMDCHQLKDVVIPEGIKVIEKRAFARCKNLERIILPPGLERIEKDAFLECNRLRHIDIPESVKFIDSNIFGDHAPYVIITGKPSSYANSYAAQNQMAFSFYYSTEIYKTNLERVGRRIKR